MIKKAQEYLKNLSRKIETEWEGFSPEIDGDTLDVPCQCCPKYRLFPPGCRLKARSGLRSCIVASMEYHFRDVHGKRVLEVGCGENSFARKVIELLGGEWFGLDRRAGKGGKGSVRSIAGEVHHIPCRDHCFDLVAGIQTIEHWPRNPSLSSDAEYEKALSEIWRVLKPGGSIYFDAPIYLHGAPEFIQADIKGISRFFSYQPWAGLKITSWRKNRGFLIKEQIACQKERDLWPGVFNHDRRILDEIQGKSTYIVSITAEKPVDAA